MARRLVVSMLAMVVLAMSPVANAQEEEERETPAPRASSLTLGEGTLEVRRPTGWSFIRPGKDALATLRSSADERAQIEIRASDGVSLPRWERFWRTFDTDLQRLGFEIETARSERSFGGRQGYLFEYALAREDQEFGLIAWHTHEGNQAWVFTLFFLSSRREAHLTTFEEMLEGLQW